MVEMLIKGSTSNDLPKMIIWSRYAKANSLEGFAMINFIKPSKKP